MDIPFRTRGKQSQEQKEREQRFADELIELDQSLDFKISARGWCYHLEAHDLPKSDFDRAEDLINSLREEGVLPIDLVATSQQRVVKGLERVSEYKTPEDFADYFENQLLPAHVELWTPASLWETQPRYVELVVEKKDLVGLFEPICEEFGVTITNMQGWSDPLTRAKQMERFMAHADEGRLSDVLYITDHDPDGLRIAELLKGHYDRLANVRWMDGHQIKWSPDFVNVQRIGLDYATIESLGLTWIDGLTTGRKNADGTKRDLADPKHGNHNHAYVQEYLKQFGPRKCEANALVARIDEAREWLRDLLLKYIDIDALNRYRRGLANQRRNFLQGVQFDFVADSDDGQKGE